MGTVAQLKAAAPNEAQARQRVTDVTDVRGDL